MNGHGRQGIKRFFILSNLGILLVLASAISVLFLRNYRQATEEYAQELREEILRSKREFIQDAVNRTIQEIEQERSRCAAEKHETCDEESIKARLRGRIRAIRLKDKGYIWINAVLNYAGGDNYAYRFVHPNLPETEGTMLSTSMRDIKGNLPYLTELEGVKKDGEIFFDYWFKKMGSETIQHKLTFAKLYRPYDWIVATGVYLDDIDELVQSGKTRWETIFQRNVLAALVITGLASLLAWFFSLLVGRRVDKIYTFFLEEVKKREEELRKFNQNLEEEIAQRTMQITASEKELRELNQELEQRVRERTAQLEVANRELETYSYQDGLTGVANRRFFDLQLEQEWRSCGRRSSQLSLIMVDIDYFKNYNDSCGHLDGDKCLKQVAARIAASARRPEDLVTRYGGEEFVVLLPDTDVKAAGVVAEAMRAGVEVLNLPHPASPVAEQVTVSLGVAGYVPRHLGNPHALVYAADLALYRAKTAGRNRVCIEYPASEGGEPNAVLPESEVHG